MPEENDTPENEEIYADGESYHYKTTLHVSQEDAFSHGTRLAEDNVVLTVKETPMSHDTEDDPETETRLTLSPENARRLAHRLLEIAKNAEQGTQNMPSKTSAEDRLFTGIFPTGIAYADKTREDFGDYARCGLLLFSTLELEIEKDCPKDMEALIRSRAKTIQDRAGEQFEVSTSGQTITLGHALKKNTPE